MDTANPVAPEAIAPQGASPATHQVPPSQPPGQEIQAPAPAGGSEAPGVPGTPTTPPQQFDPNQYISREEYEQLQSRLTERESILDQLRQMAEQEQKKTQATQFKQSVQQQIAGAYQRAADLPDSEQAVQALAQEVFQILDAVTNNYQQEVDQYHKTVEQQMWELRAPSLARDLIQQHDLGDLPGIQDDLLALGDEQAMTTYALRAKQNKDYFRTQFGQQIAAKQADDLRRSGVTAMGGEGAPGNLQPIQPGTYEQLLPVMRQFFGVRK